MRMLIDNPNLVFDSEELLAISRVRKIGLGSDRSVDNMIKRLKLFEISLRHIQQL